MSEDRHAVLDVHAPLRDGEGHLPQRRGAVRNALILTVLLLALLGYGGWSTLGRREVQAQVLDKVRAEQTKVYVTTVNAKGGQPAKPLSLPATLQGFIESPVFARANGYVLRWNHDIGSRVRKGDVLAEIDTPELEQQLAQAQGFRQQVAAQVELARTSVERWTALRAKDAAPQQELDERKAQFLQAQANLTAATAEVGRLQQLIGFKRVTAPFDGVITKRSVDVGDLVTTAANARPLFNLAKTEVLRAYVSVPQNYSHLVKLGQEVKVVRAEIPGDENKGKVIRTAQAIDPVLRTLQVEVQLDNPKGKLLPGSYVEVRVPLGKAPTLVAPLSTLQFRPEGPRVATVVDGVVVLKTIRLGRDFGNAVEVLTGITDEDALIVNPGDSIAAGDRVTVRPRAVDPAKPAEAGKPADGGKAAEPAGPAGERKP